MLATDADGLGVALRALIADDAQWALDMMLSARRANERLGTLLPMLMLGHSSRIVYEGSKALRTDPTGRQVQPFLDLLPPASSPVITAARHATKLTEGIRKPAAPLQQQMRVMLDAHRETMFGRAPSWMRSRLPELGVLSCRDQLLGVSPALQFQFGVPASVPATELGALLQVSAEEQGGTLLILAALDLDEQRLLPLQNLTGRLDLTGVEVQIDDRRSTDLIERYASHPSAVGALVLALIEGSVNTALEALRPSVDMYPGPVFRARFLTLIAALTSLRTLSDDATGLSVPRKCLELLADPRALVAQPVGGPRRLRNVLTHYRFDRHDLELDTEKPLLGLVEALGAASSFEELNAVTQQLLAEVAEALRSA